MLVIQREILPLPFGPNNKPCKKPGEADDKPTLIMEVMLISETYGCRPATECCNPGDCTLPVLTLLTDINFSFGDHFFSVNPLLFASCTDTVKLLKA
jgi:hypothetical protein